MVTVGGMGANLPAGCDLVAYGGNAEDVVLMRAFGDRSGGFFVDVGAGNPAQGSLTKNMVDRLGWRGVNIEPLPEHFERLRTARPGDVALDVAIGERPGLASFFRIVPGPGKTGGGGLSTLERDVLAFIAGPFGWAWRFRGLARLPLVPVGPAGCRADDGLSTGRQCRIVPGRRCR